MPLHNWSLKAILYYYLLLVLCGSALPHSGSLSMLWRMHARNQCPFLSHQPAMQRHRHLDLETNTCEVLNSAEIPISGCYDRLLKSPSVACQSSSTIYRAKKRASPWIPTGAHGSSWLSPPRARRMPREDPKKDSSRCDSSRTSNEEPLISIKRSQGRERRE